MSPFFYNSSWAIVVQHAKVLVNRKLAPLKPTLLISFKRDEHANIDLYNTNCVYCWLQTTTLWYQLGSCLGNCLLRKDNQLSTPLLAKMQPSMQVLMESSYKLSLQMNAVLISYLTRFLFKKIDQSKTAAAVAFPDAPIQLE